jgi:hypothetical protein
MAFVTICLVLNNTVYEMKSLPCLDNERKLATARNWLQSLYVTKF